jgi:hypothetical protein
MARSAFASATSFVHLLGLQRRPAAAEDTKPNDDDEGAHATDDTDDDKKKQRAGESDDEYAARMAADDDGGDDDSEAAAAEAAAAEAAARAAAKDDDDSGDSKANAIRLKERARCSAIFAHPAAAKRPDMAAHLAFGTNLSRAAAIDTLKAVAAGEAQMVRGVTLRSTAPARTKPADAYRARMAEQPVYEVGTDQERQPANASSPETFAKMVMAADNRRRGIAP